ncbi:MAG: hypothetical protein Q4P71_09025 [Actinomycetaceae bacterium]|nr:hypothetical protein [Actinomycetaceae bacterium]
MSENPSPQFSPTEPLYESLDDFVSKYLAAIAAILIATVIAIYGLSRPSHNQPTPTPTPSPTATTTPSPSPTPTPSEEASEEPSDEPEETEETVEESEQTEQTQPDPAPAPAPQPAPAPGITAMRTSVYSSAGSVTFTVSLTGGSAPITASVAGKSITIDGSSGTITNIPTGTHSWQTYCDGLVNSGSIYVP